MLAGRLPVDQAGQFVNPDPAAVADPMFVLLAWAGGIALATAMVTIRRLVGPGFTWLGAGTGTLIGFWPILAGDWLVGVAVALLVGGGIAVRGNRTASAALQAVAAGLFVTAATDLGGPVLAVTATLALGGITGEMLLGHWYLVDPTMPRLVLRALAIGGIVGAVVDALMVVVVVGSPAGGFATAVFWGLAATTVLLMTAVVGALRHPAYSGVMAATGLSYLAVLTGVAAVFVGRILATGAGPI